MSFWVCGSVVSSAVTGRDLGAGSRSVVSSAVTGCDLGAGSRSVVSSALTGRDLGAGSWSDHHKYQMVRCSGVCVQGDSL
jgi:hypothetical protein